MTDKILCEFCEKEFSNSQNCIRHSKTCKSNPDKKDTTTSSISLKTQILLKDQKIEMLEQQLKDKDLTIQLLQIQKSTPVQKFSNQKLSNEDPDKAIEPKYKTAIEKYINVDCKEAMNFEELILFAKENFTLDDFINVMMLKYERKYITMLKKLMEKISKKNMPIQIKSNKLNNEEGYIKIGDEFEKYFRSELSDKFKWLISGNGKKNLSNILQSLFIEYKQSSDFDLSETESEFAMFSIMGIEDNDNDSNIDKQPKKIQTLHKNLMDLFMVNL
jgi:hypothetical protein